MDHPNFAHDDTRKDLEAGRAGPCSNCGTYMAPAPDFVCTSCRPRRGKYNFCIGQDIPGCELVSFNEVELMEALKSGEDILDGYVLTELAIEYQCSSNQDTLNVIEALLPELTARYQFDVRGAFMRLRWI